ncbi:MAG: helix-turn-helix transcriptional regulator [Bacteroidales bacterium]
MVDRIKQVMKYKEMSPALFAEAIDINRSGLTHLFSGRNQPSLDLARKILKTFPEISTEWLIMGVGNMLNQFDTIQKSADNQVDLFSQENTIKTTKSTPLTPQEEILVKNQVKIDFVEENNELFNVPTSFQQTTPNISESVVDEKIEITTPELKNRNTEIKREQNLQSRSDKKTKKIIFFYEDNSFEIFFPCE